MNQNLVVLFESPSSSGKKEKSGIEKLTFMQTGHLSKINGCCLLFLFFIFFFINLDVCLFADT